MCTDKAFTMVASKPQQKLSSAYIKRIMASLAHNMKGEVFYDKGGKSISFQMFNELSVLNELKRLK